MYNVQFLLLVKLIKNLRYYFSQEENFKQKNKDIEE